MRFQKYRDVILGLCIIAFAVFYLIVGAQLVSKVKTTMAVGPKFVPRLLGILMLLLGSGISLMGFRSAKKFDSSTVVINSKADTIAVLVTFALIIGYVALLKPLGFLISTILYLNLQMLALSKKESRKPLLFAGISIAFTFFVYYVFRYALDLMLPQGILPL